MIDDLKKVMENKSLSFKLKVLFNISLNKIEDISVKDLPFELEEIKMIQKLNLSVFLIFLYINRDKVIEKLYKKEELLTIDFEIKDKKISQYIYLCFLIGDNVMCNYQYSFELINKLNEIQRGENVEIFKKIIMAKMILSLIDNYNQIEGNEDNKYKIKLDEIFNFNSKILDDKDNKTELDQYILKIEDLNSKKIEEIYIIIIKYLIENSKLEDSDYIENIKNQIELESIILTKLMLYELIKILKKEKEYIIKYEIDNFEDIINKKKINFYYNLIKYILKQSLYIYQIPFLLETRKKIFNLIKKNPGKLFPSIKKCENAYKIEYILRQFIGDNSYKYYYNASESIIKINQSYNSSQQSKNYMPNQFSKDISLEQKEDEKMNNGFHSTNESSSNNPMSRPSFKSAQKKSKRNFYNYIIYDEEKIEEKEYNYENELEYKILNKSRFILHTNLRGQSPFIIYDEIKIIKNEKEIENKTIEEIRNATTSYKELKNNYQKFLSFLDKFESILLNDFKNNYKLKMALNFETKNIENNYFLISCLYDVSIPGRNNQTFIDNNIFTDGFGEGLQYMLNEINSTNYSNKEYS